MNNKKYPILFLDKGRYILPNRWDFLALTLLFTLFGWLTWGGADMVTPYQLGQSLSLSLDPWMLPGYAGLSLLRMGMALLLSLLFTLSVGSLAAKNKYASKLLIPCIDVLQSVPVLGFLSLTVTGFIRLFSGSRLGPECAAIFAIFTAQVWNMTLSFYQSLRAVPNDLVEATTLFQLSAWQRFWRLEVPFALPGLLWNMMLSMSGSWVFLVASESIAVGKCTIHLPGIGSYLGLAIQSGSLVGVSWAVGTMLLVILIYDQLFFRPLLAWSYKFTMQDTALEVAPRSWVMTLLQRTHTLQKLRDLMHYVREQLTQSLPFPSKRFDSHRFSFNLSALLYHRFLKFGLALLTLSLLGQWVYYGAVHLDWKEMTHALLLGGVTAIRVTSVVIFSGLFWVPIGVWIGLRPRLTAFIQPIIQFLAAFPANVLFPLVAIAILKFNLSFEFGVLPLMLLSSQWYILFNVIAGVSAIPKELSYIVQNLGLSRWLWWKRLILPGIFPYLITGVMTAVGAAWNISVVAEAIQWGETVLKAVGLGAYIETASANGNVTHVAIGISAMSLWVLTMNYLIWQPLYRLAQSKYRLN